MNLMIEGKAAARNRCDEPIAPLPPVPTKCVGIKLGLVGAVADDPPAHMRFETWIAPDAVSSVQPDQPANPPAMPVPVSHIRADGR